MKYRLLFLLALLNSAFLFAQTTDFDSLWTDKPLFSEIDDTYKGENVIGIFMNERYEYYYDSEGNLLSVHLIHRRFRLNNDEAVNNFNKLSVSLFNVLEVLDIRARVIKPDGRVVEFDKNNIKEIVDEESGDNYKIFAIDGIETGDDIEYLIVRKMDSSNFGRTYFQFEYPMLKATFELISPANLLYASRGYNGIPDGVQETLEDGRHSLSCSYENMPGLKDEEYAYYTPRRARLEYKLEYNLARGKAKILTWSDASQRIYEMMYQNVDSKALDKWIKLIHVKNGTPVARAAQIEEYIKSNIHIEEFDIAEFSDLDYIRTRKVSGEQGIVKLYANLLKANGIDHQIVLTSERDNIKFDPDFQSWNYLSKYLIYLPAGDVYIDPAENTYRIGCADGLLTDTYGLFIELVKVGEFESALGKIKYIKPAPYNANYDNMNIEIGIDVEKAESHTVITRGLKGLSGGFIGRIYNTLDEERKQEILTSVMESKAINPDYHSLEVLDKSNISFISDADFIIYADFSTSSMVEIAGNKLLLNLGESIGPQVELYYDENTEREGESDFNRWYFRKIIVTVPEGYKIVNPDVADMNITETTDNGLTFGFVSKHNYSGTTYIVEIDEYYKEIFVAPEHFKGFREVINAAANFNKVVLVLEKE